MKRTPKHKQKLPFPAIVTGDGAWKVFEDNKLPRTSNLSKEMYVPLGDKCEDCDSYHDRMVRRHEMGHVKWSPKTIGKLGPNEGETSVEACEEVRIGYLLSQRKLPINDWIMCEKDARKRYEDMLLSWSEYDMICYMMASMWNSTGMETYGDTQPNNLEWRALLDTVEELKERTENGHSLLTTLRKMQINFAISKAQWFYKRITTKNRNSYGGDRYYKPTYRKVRQVAKELHALYEDFSDVPELEEVYEAERRKAEAAKKSKSSYANMDDGNSGEGEGEGDGAQTLAEAEYNTKMELMQNMGNMKYNPKADYSGAWGIMKEIKGPLQVNLQSLLKKGREYRPMDYGTNPKYISRYCIDKKIFKQKQRTYGGTILIDASGSMNFSGQDILDIMSELPAVTIAMYNDRYDGPLKDGQSRWDVGVLRIIAQGGKRVTQEYLDTHSGGGNLVDGPALDWLGKQPPARIWVSDMYVFGRRNDNSVNLLKDCQQKLKKHNITRLADINEVKRFALEINQLQ